MQFPWKSTSNNDNRIFTQIILNEPIKLCWYNFDNLNKIAVTKSYSFSSIYFHDTRTNENSYNDVITALNRLRLPDPPGNQHHERYAFSLIPNGGQYKQYEINISDNSSCSNQKVVSFSIRNIDGNLYLLAKIFGMTEVPDNERCC